MSDYNRQFKLGHLYFKFIRGTSLQSTGMKATDLSKILIDLGWIEVFEEVDGQTYYVFKTGMEPTRIQVIDALKKVA